MKTLAAFLAALTGLTAALAIGAHAAEPVDVVNIPEKAVTVDGVISDGESEALKGVACAVLQGLVTFGILNDPTNGAAF